MSHRRRSGVFFNFELKLHIFLLFLLMMMMMMMMTMMTLNTCMPVCSVTNLQMQFLLCERDVQNHFSEVKIKYLQ